MEYCGWALLTAYTGRLPAGELADWQKQFWRAGHAHAGVLLVLSLVYLLYLPRAEFSNIWDGSSESCCWSDFYASPGGFSCT